MGDVFVKLSELRELFQNQPPPQSLQDQERLADAMRAAGVDPGDFYQEMEMESPYVDTHRDTSFSNSSLSLHSHSFYEFLCCSNTCGVEYLVGTRRYRLQKGDIIVISPGVSHRPILPEGLQEPYCRDVLWISQEFAQKVYAQFSYPRSEQPPATNLVRTAGTRWEFLADLFHTGVREAEERDYGWEAAVMGNTLLLLAYLSRAFQELGTAPLRAEKPELLDRIMDYIEARLGEKLSLADTARHFYVSESTISHLFQQKMGVSFYRCVTQRRLIAAKGLIFQGSPMDQVSRQVGFQDYSSFYRAFRQEYGISPQQFRKRQAGRSGNLSTDRRENQDKVPAF